MIKKGKISGCKLANQGWVKNPDLKMSSVSKLNDMIKLSSYLIIKTECVQWCHRISNHLVNPTAERPVFLSASLGEYTQLKLQRKRDHITFTDSLIISLFSKHQHSHNSHYYEFKFQRLLQHFPFNYLIKLLIIRAARQILLLTRVSDANAKSRKSRPCQSWLN